MVLELEVFEFCVRKAGVMRVFHSLGLLVLVFSFTACRPGPIDPPFSFEVNRVEVDLSGRSLKKGSPLDQINIQELWKLSSGQDAEGRPVRIAIVGTGVDYTNPDIRNALWLNPGEYSTDRRNNQRDDSQSGYRDDVIGYDFADGDSWPYDWHGFDTFVAGILVGAGQKYPEVIGVAPNAELLVARYLNADGRGNPMDASLALRYAVDQGARVIYFNWPSGGFGDWDSMVLSALAYAGEKNVIVVTGAGNDGNQNLPALLTAPGHMGEMEHVIVVSALDGPSNLSVYTNYGRGLSDIAAPVEGSRSYLPGGELTEAIPATAIAAAYVTGVVALLSTQPGMNRVQDIRRALLQAAKLPNEGRLETLSGGSLNVAGLGRP